MKMVRLKPPAELDMPIGEAMFSQRAIRRLDRGRPIGDGQLKIVLDAASKAPSGGNAQVARFLVIRDRQRIAAFGELDERAVAHQLDDAPAMTVDSGVDKLGAVGLKRGERARLVLIHQSAVAGDISTQDRCQPAFNTLPCHPCAPGFAFLLIAVYGRPSTESN